MDRVARLEGDDPPPAALGERRLRLGRRLVAAHERLVVVGQRVHLDLAGDAALALAIDRRDARVLGVGRPVDLLGLEGEVALEDLADVEASERLAVRRREVDHIAGPALEVGRERDRDRPVLPRRQAHRLTGRAPVVGAQKAAEGREAPDGEQLEVRGLARRES